MDRDQRWERVALAYDALVHAKGTKVKSAAEAMQNSYAAQITDEFVLPHIITDAAGNALPSICADDVVICFNYRTDRLRELSQVLSQKAMPEYHMEPLSLYYVTITRYDASFKNVHIMYEKDDIAYTLGEVLSEAGATQLRIAETEKYPHVTFFFNGGRETPFEGESRIVIPSPKVATYDLQPEMSAREITAALLNHIEDHSPDFVCLNFANTDMVGHTGDFKAAMVAANTVDQCLARIVPYALHYGYSLLIIADHGNSDCMINPDGSPNTAHTINPVPCIYVARMPISPEMHTGCLADVAPTMLHIMGVKQPAAMSGRSLLITDH
jgi:2,3-bisphosphoglycerate-independent phosphoglycerate mutase